MNGGKAGNAAGTVLVDTSVWVEYLRATGSPAHVAVRGAIVAGAALAVLDVVRLELLAGTGTEAEARELQRLLARFHSVPADSPADHDRAAELYRAARRGGQTVRSLTDCLVAAAAMRMGAPLLARDRDFEILASISTLQLA